jgi:tetratricopeptide (TPR) repeat protein
MGRGDPQRNPHSKRPVPIAQTCQTAIALQYEGKLDQAAELYRLILRHERDHFDALNNLGAIRAQKGFAAEAEKLFRRALRQRPQSPETHYNLALALGALNRPRDSASHMERAAALGFAAAVKARDDANPGASVMRDFNAALVYQQQGNSREAERLYRAVLGRDPLNFEALNNLGVLYVKVDRYGEAAAVLARAVEQRPSSAEAHHSLAMALRMLNRYEEATVPARRAIAIRPDYAEAHTNLGFALFGLRRLDEALTSIERAIALKPDFAPAYADLGQTLAALGRLDEARTAFENAIARDPSQPGFYQLLGHLKRFAADDPQLAAMEAFAGDPDRLSPGQQLVLHFGLGKAYSDLGRYEQSFGHLLEGNRLMRQRIVYDEPLHLNWLERIRAVFTPELMRMKAGQGDPTDVPVFIIGMPRSGSTLIEQILASHPMVSDRGELRQLKQLAERLEGPPGTTERYPEVMPLVSAERLRALGRDYRDALGADAPGVKRITDKMPSNFAFAGLVALALPNARIIHTRRNPLDTCLSCFSLLFAGDQQPQTYDLGELGRYFRTYETLMEHWRALLPPGMMLEVDYEDVVADLEGQARRLIAHCGLPWDDACLDFHRTDRRIMTASFAQVRQPLYRNSIARSRPYMHLLGPLLDALAGKG